MGKKPAFIEIEDCLIKRSLIQSVEVHKNYYDDKFLVITYYNGQEVKSLSTKIHSDDYIEKMFKEIKEVLS